MRTVKQKRWVCGQPIVGVEWGLLYFQGNDKILNFEMF